MRTLDRSHRATWLERAPPWAWCMLGAWLVSVLYLVAVGKADNVAIWSFIGAYQLLLAGIIVRLTHPMPEDAPSLVPTTTPVTIWSQLGVIGAFIALTGFVRTLPVWSNMTAALSALGERLLPAEIVGGPGNAIANPVQYFALPFVLLLVLGARPAELGLGRGHRVLRTCLAWIAAPAIFWIVLLASGQLTVMRLLRAVVGNALQNGFFEEFLFRGALQTRLNKLVQPGWALVIQALAFGVWHFNANAGVAPGDPFAALAACVVSQAVSGLAYGIVFLRTRNLVAPSVAHVVMNAVGRTL
ncbi:MAG: type II CAAX endopeptidase family protein [Anaerolineae bacterium]|nr:CPBP family intramembrane metalloprotease [Candidatus Roseilinea sp.]MDW8448447.1 type II CAAX endopeptidase family protein [Anaerolineae bacterium]